MTSLELTIRSLGCKCDDLLFEVTIGAERCLFSVENSGETGNILRG